MSRVLIGNIKGPSGADGFSPAVQVASNTDKEYKLNISTKDGVITTPNLKGADGEGVISQFEEIKIPAEFPSMPFKFYRDTDGKVKHDYTFDQFKDGYTEIYVANSGSNDTGDGSSTNPYRTMQMAFDMAEAGPDSSYIIKVSDSLITRNYAYVVKTITKNISVVGIGPTRTILPTAIEQLTWTADGVGTWRTARTEVYGVFDLEKTDSYGEPTPYGVVSSLEQCKSQPGTWYEDGSSIWVHTETGEFPTIRSHAVCINQNMLKVTLAADVRFYMENLRFIAGRENNCVAVCGDGNIRGTFVANKCSFLGSNLRNTGATPKLGNAMSVQDVKNAYIFECLAAYSGRDGFNYHYETMWANSATKNRIRECLAVEYDCISYNHGIYSQGGADNASTCHEGACIIRVGTIGFNTRGPVIHDIMGCLSYALDCHMYRAIGTTPAKTAAYYFENTDGILEGKAWLVNCIGDGDNYSVNTDSGFELYLKGFKGEKIPEGLNITYLD